MPVRTPTENALLPLESFQEWQTPEWSKFILGTAAWPGPAPAPPVLTAWTKICHRRIRFARKKLQDAFVGFAEGDPGTHGLKGHLVDWLLAGLIARENVLLVSRPGTAKTELSLLTFRMFRLQEATASDASLSLPVKTHEDWQTRSAREREHQKYFHYLLTRYTQQDELFGPIELEFLKRGILVRVNFSFATGPGVRACFLDEVFKASSSVLNTLLTLMQEHTYFNWGANVPADMAMLIGATNEMPGSLRSAGLGTSHEDFATLYAFLDRFSVRLKIPPVSGSNHDDPVQSDLAKATELAVNREADHFCDGDHFHGFQLDAPDYPCVNDLLFLGRVCLESLRSRPVVQVFRPERLQRFRAAFYRVAATLQSGDTDLALERITWTISPRKLRSLFKVSLAHALLCDANFSAGADTADGLTRSAVVDGPGWVDLGSFHHLWDTPDPEVMEGLVDHTAAVEKRY